MDGGAEEIVLCDVSNTTAAPKRNSLGRKGDAGSMPSRRSSFGKSGPKKKKQQHQQQGPTLQRFSVKIDGRAYHVRIFEKTDGLLYASFFDQEAGKVVRIKRLQRQWLENLDQDTRTNLLTSSFFRENAASLLHATVKRAAPSANQASSSVSSSTPTSASAPRRAPPPVPPPEEKEKEEKKEVVMVSHGTQTMSLMMNGSPEMAQLKMELMDQREISERLARERDEWREKHDRLNEDLTVIEQEYPAALETRSRELEELARELTNVQHQLNVYKNQAEQYSRSEQEARDRVEVLERTLEDERARSERMGEDVRAARQKLVDMDEEHRGTIKDLSTSLEEMTESYNAHKEYGATLKAKILEVRGQAESQVEALDAEKNQVQLELEKERERVKMGERKLRELGAELQDAREEGANAQSEFVALGHECAQARNRCKELEDEVEALREFAIAHQNEADHARGEIEAQRSVYEEQRQNLIRSHRNEIKDLKVKLFDAADASDAKAKEVQELSGYVNEILAQQETYEAIMCDNCKARAASSAASAMT
ncbi:Hypothetical Protein FCC1311_010082 [Hondaea fermentalgiana]|uniref:Uncharacterized protein n=1 Tax=Hondaea fermentalgiana TaxID=2315210 RepID=A0A2R5G1A6_9STRA|nr:Hypothetical Protein FCC1311_010082 [Hondaea fermentalgiana]|eukprot:GBG24790.1 Hypothetical Protein FCC1311_010082 [Hondaea fermentalgiana]